jgi:hypothetical protein
LNKPENRDYFRGPANVQRVQAWRAIHPGYWRHQGGLAKKALQEDSSAQATETKDESGMLTDTALQDLLSNQPVVLIGLIGHLTGSALLDDIAETTRRLIGLGRDILNLDPEGGRHVHETRIVPGTGPPDSTSVQLGRSAIDPR